MTNSVLKGQCMCRSVTYEVTDAFAYAMYCHCSDCRRRTGSAFKPFGGIKLNEVKVVNGIEHVIAYGDQIDHDLLCSLCGSLLYSVVREGEYAHVTLGTLVDAPSIQPLMHIFVGSKAPWYTITDNLPQHDELP
ncbi:MAG: GFA family protein [Paracoccaceae bacterium]